MRQQERCIDIPARRAMAVLLRDLAARRITVEEFEEAERGLDTNDRAVTEAYFFAWGHYCDFRTTYMVGRWRLTRAERAWWSRMVLYLMTDQNARPFKAEHPWGCYLFVGLFCALTLANWLRPDWGLPSGNWLFLLLYGNVILSTLYDKILHALRIERKCPAPPDFWPFLSQEDFDRAKASPNPFATWAT